MALADDVARELSFLRAQAASMMQDRLEFGTFTKGGQDADSGLEEPTFTAAFSTPGKIKGSPTGAVQNVRMVEVGGTERPVIDGGVHIPADRAEVVRYGMFVRVVKVGPRSPRHLLGRVYRIEGESVTSNQTARRFDVVEVP